MSAGRAGLLRSAVESLLRRRGVRGVTTGVDASIAKEENEQKVMRGAFRSRNHRAAPSPTAGALSCSAQQPGGGAANAGARRGSWGRGEWRNGSARGSGDGAASGGALGYATPPIAGEGRSASLLATRESVGSFGSAAGLATAAGLEAAVEAEGEGDGAEGGVGGELGAAEVAAVEGVGFRIGGDLMDDLRRR